MLQLRRKLNAVTTVRPTRTQALALTVWTGLDLFRNCACFSKIVSCMSVCAAGNMSTSRPLPATPFFCSSSPRRSLAHAQVWFSRADSTFLHHTCVCWQQHITPLLYRLNTLAHCTGFAEVKGHSEWFRSPTDARFLVAAAAVQGSPVVPNHGVLTSATRKCVQSTKPRR